MAPTLDGELRHFEILQKIRGFGVDGVFFHPHHSRTRAVGVLLHSCSCRRVCGDGITHFLLLFLQLCIPPPPVPNAPMLYFMLWSSCLPPSPCGISYSPLVQLVCPTCFLYDNLHPWLLLHLF